jgi:hypothetical protein
MSTTQGNEIEFNKRSKIIAYLFFLGVDKEKLANVSPAPSRNRKVKFQSIT